MKPRGKEGQTLEVKRASLSGRTGKPPREGGQVFENRREMKGGEPREEGRETQG